VNGGLPDHPDLPARLHQDVGPSPWIMTPGTGAPAVAFPELASLGGGPLGCLHGLAPASRSCTPRRFPVPMWVESVFWVALAVGFLALAVVAARERAAVAAQADPLGSFPHVMIAGPVASVLGTLLLVEIGGFVLAAAAAIFSAAV
jgi:hypothetical protein